MSRPQSCQPSAVAVVDIDGPGPGLYAFRQFPDNMNGEVCGEPAVAVSGNLVTAAR